MRIRALTVFVSISSLQTVDDNKFETFPLRRTRETQLYLKF